MYTSLTQRLGALPDDTQSYVRSKTSPSIYAVDAKLLEDIRKAPSDIPG